jgi:hypothetical protein
MRERPVLLSRRAITGGLLAGAGFVSVGMSGVGDPESVLDAEEYSGDSSEMERRLTKRYGIPIYILRLKL